MRLNPKIGRLMWTVARHLGPILFYATIAGLLLSYSYHVGFKAGAAEMKSAVFGALDRITREAGDGR